MVQLMAYRAVLEDGEAAGVRVITFPDVPEAITQAGTDDDVQTMAAEALGLALLIYARDGRPLPKPSIGRRGSHTREATVAVEPDVAAKIAVVLAFRGAGISRLELARRLGKDEKEVRRILDPMHPTKIGPLSNAMRALGRRLVIGFDDVTEAQIGA